MTDRLVIYLSANEVSQCLWLANDTLHVGETEYLQEAARDREVVVFVPARDVLLLSAELPKMNRTRMMQALPFALEEQLIADVEDLHFALQDPVANGRTSVAVVAIAKMHEWMGQLKEWGVHPNVMMSAVFALPWGSQSWSVAVTRDAITVRDDLYHGFGSELDTIEFMLQALLSETKTLPESIKLLNFTSEVISFAFSVPIEEVPVASEKDLLSYSSVNKHISGVNLLQGGFAVKSNKRLELHFGWKLVSLLAVTIAIVLFIKPIVSNIILSSELRSVNNQIARIYKRHFPQSVSIVAPKQRMQEKLQQLAANTSDSQVLLQLGIIGKALERNDHIRITRYDYQNGDASIDLNATDSDSFTQFTDFLTDRGLTVKQQNANLIGGRINASIQITAS